MARSYPVFGDIEDKLDVLRVETTLLNSSGLTLPPTRAVNVPGSKAGIIGCKLDVD